MVFSRVGIGKGLLIEGGVAADTGGSVVGGAVLDGVIPIAVAACTTRGTAFRVGAPISEAKIGIDAEEEEADAETSLEGSIEVLLDVRWLGMLVGGGINPETADVLGRSRGA